MDDLIPAIWGELKRYINTVDRNEAAENLVTLLIDNDCAPEDIKAAFKSDNHIKQALSEYIDDTTEEDLDEEDDYDDLY